MSDSSRRYWDMAAFGLIFMLLLVDSFAPAGNMSVGIRILGALAAISALTGWWAIRHNHSVMLKASALVCFVIVGVAGTLPAGVSSMKLSMIALVAAGMSFGFWHVAKGGWLIVIRALGVVIVLLTLLLIHSYNTQQAIVNAVGLAQIAANLLIGITMMLRFDADDTGHRVARFCAAVMFGISLTVMAGWLLGVALIVQGGTRMVPMQFNTALCMLLSGLALWLLTQRKTIGALVLLLPVAAIALATLLEEYTGSNTGIADIIFNHTMSVEGVKPGRMTPNSAVAFLFGILAALLAPRRANASLTRWSPTWACGFVVFTIAAIVITGYAVNMPSIRSWGLHTPMALLSSIGFAFYGMGLGFLGMESKTERIRRSVVLPLLVAIASVVVSTLVWQSIEQNLVQQSQRELRRNLVSLTHTMEEARSVRLEALERHRKRMASDVKAQAALFKLDSRIYLQDFPSIRSFTWLDRELRILDFSSQPTLSLSPGCGADTICQALLAGAVRGNTKRVSKPQWLADGGLGQWIVMTVRPINAAPSYVLVQLDNSVLLRSALDNTLPGSPLQVSYEGKPIYARKASYDLPAQSLDYEFGSLVLRLDTWATSSASNFRWPNLLLIFGLVVGGLLAMALRLAALARDRAELAEAVGNDLRLTMADRERTQIALAQTEKELGTLVEDMADGFVMLDTQWNFVYMNHRAEVILRRSREELIGTYCWAEFPEAVENPMHQAYQRAVQEGVAVSLETYYPPLECWLEIRAHPYPKGLAVYFQDISARRENAEKLSQTETLLKIAGQTAHFGGWSVDIASGKVQWSDEVCSIHGMPPGYSLSLKEGINFYAPSSQAVIAEAVAKCANEGIAFDEELQIINARGDLVWVRVVGQPVRDSSGAIVRMNGAFQEIHERKRHEQERTKESMFLKIMLENLSEGIVACDAHGVLSLFNRATREFHGLPEEALSPEKWSEHYNLYLADGQTLMSVEQIPLFRALRGEAVRDVEMVIKPTNQPARLVLCNGDQIKTDTGELLGAVIVMFDITHRRQSELNLTRTGRALRMVTACNEAIIRAENEAALLEDVCKVVVEIGGYRLVWVGFKQNDTAKTIEIAARAGEGMDYLSQLNVSWSEDVLAGQGPAGHTIRNNSPFIVKDVAADPLFTPWAAAALERNLRGVVCLPLRENDQVIGILNLYAGEVRAVEAEEVSLLQDLADDLAFGIATLRGRAEKQRLESALLKLAGSVSAGVDDTFFQQLSRNMAEATGADAAFVAKLLPGEPLTARTISAIVDGELIENFDYFVSGSPCEGLTKQEECAIVDNVSELFPASYSLSAMNAQAYVGRRLDDSNGRPLGLLFVLFRKTLKHHEMVASSLRIFASRAAAELERQQADIRLQEQASLLDKAQDAIIVRSVDGKISFWNKGAERLYGWTAQEAIGRWIRELLQEDPSVFLAAESILAKENEWRGEITGRRKDGSRVIVEARWTLMKDGSGQPSSILTIKTDITKRKRIEQMDEGQRSILAGIAARRPLTETLNATALLYEAQCPGALCSVLLMDETGKVLKHGAGASLPDAYNEAVDGVAIGEAVGSCGTALWRGERVIVGDIANDPLWKNYVSLALAHGLRACWSTPIIASDGKAVASFAVYYREVREPTELELQAIDDIAALAGIAIEQSNAYRNLALSEQRFRSLFYEHPDAVCAMDLDGRFVDYNGGFYASTGISPVDVIGQMFDERIAPENRQMAREHFNAAAKGEAQTYESSGITPDGERFDFRVTNLPIMVEGKITGVFGIAHDISALRRRERELAEALARAQENSRQLRRLSQVAMVINQQVGQDTNLEHELVDLLRDTIGVHQATLSLVQGDGVARDIDVASLSDKYAQWKNRAIAFDNKEIYALLSNTNGSLRLSQSELAMHPLGSGSDSETAMRPPMRDLLAVPLLRGDGTHIGMLQLSEKLEGDFTEDDELIAVQFAGMASTAIERNRLIERLRERDRFFEMSLEIFVIFNPATKKWTQVNPVFAQLTGFSQEELCAVEFLNFLHADDRSSAEERSRLLRMGQGVANSYINRYVCRDGSLRWIEWVSVPSPGGLVYAVGRDITERRKSEIALQKTLTDLNNRNRELQDFAFVASHDLQEPLRKIRAFSDRLTTRYHDTMEVQALDYLDRMNKAATRMQVLIDDLLAYSRVATRVKAFTQVNLAQVCTEVLSDLDARIESTQAQIFVDPLPTIAADATQMQQLFQNLLANALKFHSVTRRPEINITCTAIMLGQEPGFRIEFSDNGIGFELKYAERIFTAFQRLHSRAEYEGTGIGLAIVRRIVERHHGSIEAFSEPDVGTRFVICIPHAPHVDGLVHPSSAILNQ